MPSHYRKTPRRTLGAGHRRIGKGMHKGMGMHKGGAKTRIIGQGVFGKFGKTVKRKLAPKMRSLMSKTSGFLKGIEKVADTYDGPYAEKASKAAHDIRKSIGKARSGAATIGKETAARKSKK